MTRAFPVKSFRLSVSRGGKWKASSFNFLFGFCWAVFGLFIVVVHRLDFFCFVSGFFMSFCIVV